MYEYPPILKGTLQEQVTALREYLVRIAAEQNKDVTGAGGRLDSNGLDRLQKQVEELGRKVERLERHR